MQKKKIPKDIILAYVSQMCISVQNVSLRYKGVSRVEESEKQNVYFAKNRQIKNENRLR
jgi:hypothetical protein